MTPARLRAMVLGCVALLFVAQVASAQIVTVRTIFDNVSASSGTSAEFSAAGPNTFNVQVCGTGFSGTFTVNQGSKTGALAATKSVTKAVYTGCTEYYWFNASALVQFGFTRSAGSMTLTFEHFPK